MKQHEYHEFMKSRTLNWRRQPFSYDHRHRHARFALWIRNQWCMDHRGAWALAVYIMSLNDPLRTTDYSITSTIITWATHQYSRCMSLHVGFPPSPIHHIALRWHFVPRRMWSWKRPATATWSALLSKPYILSDSLLAQRSENLELFMDFKRKDIGHIVCSSMFIYVHLFSSIFNLGHWCYIFRMAR